MVWLLLFLGGLLFALAPGVVKRAGVLGHPTGVRIVGVVLMLFVAYVQLIAS